jgi:hypothetical protein
MNLFGKSAHFTHNPVGFTCVKNGFCTGWAEIARYCSDNSCLALGESADVIAITVLSMSERVSPNSLAPLGAACVVRTFPAIASA